MISKGNKAVGIANVTMAAAYFVAEGDAESQ